MKKFLPFVALATLLFCSTAFITDSIVSRKLPKPLRNHYAHIPAGAVLIGEEKTTVEDFYMSKTEVSNLEYLEFLHDLKKRGETEQLQIARVDSGKWIVKGTYNQPFAATYHKHPAYHHYPVVNISKEGAELYCQWLGETLTKNNPDLIFEARLPTRKEWIRAARPKHIIAPYAWGGYYLQNAKGQLLCNFKRIGAESIAFDPATNSYVVKDKELNDQAHCPAPVDAFVANSAGLHQMNGNVAELTSEGLACGGSWNSPGYDVRIDSYFEVAGPSPQVGFRPLLSWRKR